MSYTKRDTEAARLHPEVGDVWRKAARMGGTCPDRKVTHVSPSHVSYVTQNGGTTINRSTWLGWCQGSELLDANSRSDREEFAGHWRGKHDAVLEDLKAVEALRDADADSLAACRHRIESLEAQLAEAERMQPQNGAQFERAVLLTIRGLCGAALKENA